MDALFKFVVSLALAAVGLAGMWYLKINAPQVKPHYPEEKIQVVEVGQVIPQTVTIPVFSRGEVIPKAAIQLVMEVSGQVVYISPNLVNGGFFEKGEVLLKVEDERYRLDITKAQARVVSAEQKYLRLQNELSVDEDIIGLPSPQQYKDNQLKEMMAQINAAKADLTFFKMQLEKSVLRAPFRGRVQQALVGQGQIISPGLKLAQVYPVDLAEVRLPLSDRQLALVDIPNSPSGLEQQPEVTFKLGFGNRDYFWQGKIVRTEGGLDQRNRLLYAIAQIDNPYQADPNQPGRPPLAAGQFLEAEVQGRQYDQVVVLPREVLRNGRELWVYEEGRIYRRGYDLLYKSKDAIFITDGLHIGDLIVLTPMDIAIEGMKVQATSYGGNMAKKKLRRVNSLPAQFKTFENST